MKRILVCFGHYCSLETRQVDFSCRFTSHTEDVIIQTLKDLKQKIAACVDPQRGRLFMNFESDEKLARTAHFHEKLIGFLA